MRTLEEEIEHYLEGLGRPPSPVDADREVTLPVLEEDIYSEFAALGMDKSELAASRSAATDRLGTFRGDSSALAVRPSPIFQDLRTTKDQRTNEGFAFFSRDDPSTTQSYTEQATSAEDSAPQNFWTDSSALTARSPPKYRNILCTAHDRGSVNWSRFKSRGEPPTASPRPEEAVPPPVSYARISSSLPVGTEVPYSIDARLDAVPLKADETQDFSDPGERHIERMQG